MAEPRQVVTTSEAAEILHVSPQTVKRYFAAGTLGGFKLPSGVLRIYSAEIERLMEGK